MYNSAAYLKSFRVLFFLFQCCWWDHQVRKTQTAIGSCLSPSWQKLRRRRHSFQWRCWPCPSAQDPTEDQQDSDEILSPAVSREESWKKFHKTHKEKDIALCPSFCQNHAKAIGPFASNYKWALCSRTVTTAVHKAVSVPLSMCDVHIIL